MEGEVRDVMWWGFCVVGRPRTVIHKPKGPSPDGPELACIFRLRLPARRETGPPVLIVACPPPGGVDAKKGAPHGTPLRSTALVVSTYADRTLTRNCSTAF
jgi:hypothetical protein